MFWSVLASINPNTRRRKQKPAAGAHVRAWARRVRVRGGSAPRAADAADDEEEDDEERSELGSQLIDQNSQVLWTGSALRTGSRTT